MNRLTVQERWILCAFVFLLILGMVVQTLRNRTVSLPKDDAVQETEAKSPISG